jgi:two-component system, response regulator
MLPSDTYILLVEDNESDALLTIRALKKNNLAGNLVHLTDGAQALDFIFAKGEYLGRNIEHKPKVILLDLKMPKVSGLEVLEIIKKDDRTRKIPVVMMTSSQHEKDILESHEHGVNSYIVKPVDFDDFSAAVSKLGTYWVTINNTPF